MRLLFFAPRDCRPANTGAKLRNYHLCRELSRHADVTYLAFADAPAPAASPEMAKRVITVPHRGGRSPVKLARGLVGHWPYTVLNYTTPEMQEQLANLLRENSFDAVQVESLLLAAYLPILQAANPRPLLVCDWHNVDSEVLLRYAEHAPNAARRLYARATARRLAALERESMPLFDAHLTVSDRDGEQLRSLSPASRIYTVENGVDAPAFEAPAAATPHRIVFVGSMDYHPNVDAAVHFANQVWPQVHREQPDWVFTIVGRAPAPAVSALAERAGIEVTGTVDDVRPYYREAVAAVVPLRVGGGSRLKILEAMAARVPVVSTTLGAEGLELTDGKHVLVGDTPDQLAGALLNLAREPQKYRPLVEAAHALALERYDWAAVGAKLRSIYETLGRARTGAPQEVAA